MNEFESLCKLASDENWCWNLACPTCGHMHFRYALSELASGKSPCDDNWLIHFKTTKYSNRIGPLPKEYTKTQKETILNICTQANISVIATTCKFPDWLGYLGLVLEHMRLDSNSYSSLSLTWSRKLLEMMPINSLIHNQLEYIVNNNILLGIKELEKCELEIMRNKGS